MARRAPATRSTLRLVVPLPLVVLAGCTGGPPQVCSLVLLESSVTVDLSALDVGPRSVDALLCVGDDCEAGSALFGDDAAEPVIHRTDPDIPSRSTAEITVVLTDPDTGAELYRGDGTVPVEVVEPNGPGCGETRILPTVIADPDGTLRS